MTAFTPADLAALICEDLRLHAPGTAAIIERVIAEHWPAATKPAPGVQAAARRAAETLMRSPVENIVTHEQISAVIASEFAALAQAGDELALATDELLSFATHDSECNATGHDYGDAPLDCTCGYEQAMERYRATRPALTPTTNTEAVQEAREDDNDLAYEGWAQD